MPGRPTTALTSSCDVPEATAGLERRNLLGAQCAAAARRRRSHFGNETPKPNAASKAKMPRLRGYGNEITELHAPLTSERACSVGDDFFYGNISSQSMAAMPMTHRYRAGANPKQIVVDLGFRGVDTARACRPFTGH